MEQMPIDPIKLSSATENIVVKDRAKKYYRFRADRWYGGIATADTVGCNLRCAFCWSARGIERPEKAGSLYSPVEVAEKLCLIASKKGFDQVRVSGGEPTIGIEHLVALLEEMGEKYRFILETNGILLGHDRTYAERLARFDSLAVRISLKGASPEEFARLTGARAVFFEYQLRAMENLLAEGIEAHASAMLSFSTSASIQGLMDRLGKIDKRLVSGFEEEYVILYPSVRNRLRKADIKPKIAYTPQGVPSELI